ncbi:MAG: MBL fold metallo-hydrolase, partial [Halobacteriaceae archaeon]
SHRDLDIDLFLPPIGNFTMNRFAEAKLAEDLTPDLVVPIHYNTFETLAVQPDGNAAAFAGDVAKHGIPVALDDGGNGHLTC